MFHRKVDANGCWDSDLRKADHGYTVLFIDGKRHYAHRLAWTVFKGPVASGLQIDHLCRNRACFNPEHLEPVTPQENMLRGESRGALAVRRGMCMRGHARDAWGERYGVRTQCRLCNIAYLRAYKERRRTGDTTPIDLDAIFGSRRLLRRYDLLDITPDDVALTRRPRA